MKKFKDFVGAALIIAGSFYFIACAEEAPTRAPLIAIKKIKRPWPKKKRISRNFNPQLYFLDNTRFTGVFLCIFFSLIFLFRNLCHAENLFRVMDWGEGDSRRTGSVLSGFLGKRMRLWLRKAKISELSIFRPPN